MAKRSQFPTPSKKKTAALLRAAVEVGFIIFLFYSNLLMGEFIRSNNPLGKSLLWAIQDVVTPENLAIALVTGVIGHFIFEALRRKL